MITVEMNDKNFSITEAYKCAARGLMERMKSSPDYREESVALVKLISVSLNTKGIWRLVFMCDGSNGETYV